MDKKTLTVVAAIIRRENKILICRRPPDKARALLWEFVGGKVENGETKQQALVRECREELAVQVAVFDEFFHTVHNYSDATVDLTVFCAEITGGTVQMLEHSALAWVSSSELDNYDFCPADRPILEKLKKSF